MYKMQPTLKDVSITVGNWHEGKTWTKVDAAIADQVAEERSVGRQHLY